MTDKWDQTDRVAGASARTQVDAALELYSNEER